MNFLPLVLKYWREGVIGLAVVIIFAACMSRDHAIKERGVAQERARVADSLLHISAKEIRVWDTIYRTDTVRYARLALRTDTLRDSVLVHLTDTVRVKELIAQSDSALRACSVIANDCAHFRQLAEQRFNEYELKLKAATIAPARQHLGLGATCGLTESYGFTKPVGVSTGVGCAAGLTYRW